MPENQNMQKTSDNEAMLQEIVQNTEMGKNTLDELMGLTYDQKLKDEMMRQKNEYRRLNQQAHTALDAIGAQAKGQSAAARMSVSMGIRTRTMLDKSTRNLATMLATGSHHSPATAGGQRPGRAGLQARRNRLPPGQPRRPQVDGRTVRVPDRGGAGVERICVSN